MSGPPERVGAIVLAGGRSSRFGRDKLAEPVGGRPMLDLAIDAVRVVAIDIVVVTAPDGSPTNSPDVAIARDARAFEGPLAGLAAGLAAFDPSVRRAIVVGGDMPSLVPPVLQRMLDELASADVVVLETDDGPRPLPLAIRPVVVRPVIDRLLAAGERRLRALLTAVRVVALDQATWRQDDPDGASLRDVDVPEDLSG
jgi:molybdopterin-guanine dinucleotide biosynthesis protein A